MLRTHCNRKTQPGSTNLYLWLVLLLGMMSSFSALAEPAGRLLFAKGEVQVLREGEAPRMATRGDVIEVGDTIRTGEGARAQLRMNDGAMVALHADTRYRIDAQNYEKENPEQSSQAARLLRGGLRAITGAIGKENPSAVKLSTPVATIGIRGTVYETIYVPPGGLPGLPDVPPGHYTLVLGGEVSVSNPAGELTVGVGEIAYVADADTPPELRPDLSWLFARYATFEEDDGGNGSDDTNGDTGGSTDPDTGDVGNVLTESAVPQATVKPGPYALAMLIDGATVYEGSFVTNVVSVNSSGELVNADGGTYGLIDTIDATGTAFDIGSVSAGDSTIYWGSYDANTGVTLYNSSGNPITLGATSGINIHYIDSTQVMVNIGDLPTTGSYTYSWAGGAYDLNVFNIQSSSKLQVDFGSATMSVNIDTSFGSSWTASNQNISDFYGAGVTLNNSSTLTSGTINGHFVGSNAEGAMTSFEIDSGDGIVGGVGAFTR